VQDGPQAVVLTLAQFLSFVLLKSLANFSKGMLHFFVRRDGMLPLVVRKVKNVETSPAR